MTKNRAFIKEIDEAGFITFTADELKDMLKETYNRGYNDGVYRDKYDDNNLVVESDTNSIVQLVQE